MKRLFRFTAVCFALIPLGVAHLHGQAAPAPAAGVVDGPRIHFAEIHHDFGRVKAADSLRHDFIFTNVGNAVLEVSDVRPGCGCTTAAEWDRVVQPGKTGKIPIQFNPGGFFGTVSKTITVTCNDLAQQTQLLHIKATVWRPIDVQPAQAYFTMVEGSASNDTKIVKIVNNMDEDVTLEAPQSTSPAFKAEVKTIRPGKEFALEVTYDSTATNTLRQQGTITVKTSSTNTPTLTVSAFCLLQPLLMAVPQQIHLPNPVIPNQRMPVIVRNNGPTPVTLSEPSVNAEGVTVQMYETQPGKAFSFSLVFPEGFQVEPGKSPELTIKTSHPKYPVMRIPISQLGVVTPAVPAPPKAASTK